MQQEQGWGWLRAQGRLQHLQILGQAPASPRQAPRDRELSHPARTTGKEPLHIPSHLLVSQEELQVTVSPIRIRLCPWLQLVPLVIPAVQVLQAQRDKREALVTLPRRRSHSETRESSSHCVHGAEDSVLDYKHRMCSDQVCWDGCGTGRDLTPVCGSEGTQGVLGAAQG